MSMNGISDIDDYDSYDFHFMNRYDQKRPLFWTTPNSVYSLNQGETGSSKEFTTAGKPTATPR